MCRNNRRKAIHKAGLIAVVLILSSPAQAVEHTFGGDAGGIFLGPNDCTGTVLEITNPNITEISHFRVHLRSVDPLLPLNARLNWYIAEQLSSGKWKTSWKGRNSPAGLGMGKFWEQSPKVNLPLSQGTRTAFVMCWEYSPGGSMEVVQSPGGPLPELLAYGDPADGGRLRDVTTPFGPHLGLHSVFNYTNAGYHMRVGLVADYDGDGWDDTVDCDDLDSTLNLDDDDGDGFSTCAGDCNDVDAAIYPGAPEVCNSVDDNCDGLVDDADPLAILPAWFADSDGDEEGDSFVLLKQCSQPTGYVSNWDDCDDTDWTQNHWDKDGDGTASCDGDCDDFLAAMNVDDDDGDGFSTCAADCNDGDVAIYPGAPEVCNSIDDNCDGQVDESAFSSGLVGGGEDFSGLALDGNYDSMGNPQFAQVADPSGLGDDLILLNEVGFGRAGRALAPWLEPPAGSWTLAAYFTIQIPDNGDAAGYAGLAFVLLGASYVTPSTIPSGNALGFRGSGAPNTTAGGVGLVFDTSPSPSCSPNCPGPWENWIELVRSASGYGPEASVELCPVLADPSCTVLNPRGNSAVPINQVHPVKIVVDYDAVADETSLSAWIHTGGVASLVLPAVDWWADSTLVWEQVLVNEVVPNDGHGFDPSQPFQAGWTAATGSTYPQEHRVDNVYLTCPVPVP